jgi:hypothetical protein
MPVEIPSSQTDHPDILEAEFTETTDPTLAKKIVDDENRYAKNGMIFGGLCILGGIILLFLGIAGAVNWSIKVGGIDSSLTNAAPGVVLMVIGFLIICVTKSKIIITK